MRRTAVRSGLWLACVLALASAGSASATVTKVQNDLNTAVNQSQADYDKEMSNLQTKTGKAGIADWAPMSDQAWVATTLFKGTLATASKNSPDPIWEAEHGNHLKGVEALFSNKLFQLAPQWSVADQVQLDSVQPVPALGQCLEQHSMALHLSQGGYA